MSNKWLLVETFGGRPTPSLIAVGSTPKKMIPLASVLARGHHLDLVQAAVAQAASTGNPIELPTDDQARRAIAIPLKAFTGHVHGVFVWVGAVNEAPPGRDPAGAWHFNLTTDTIGGSTELLDLYGVPPENRQTERATAEAFERLIPNADATAAMAIIVRSQPGENTKPSGASAETTGNFEPDTSPAAPSKKPTTGRNRSSCAASPTTSDPQNTPQQRPHHPSWNNDSSKAWPNPAPTEPWSTSRPCASCGGSTPPCHGSPGATNPKHHRQSAGSTPKIKRQRRNCRPASATATPRPPCGWRPRTATGCRSTSSPTSFCSTNTPPPGSSP